MLDAQGWGAWPSCSRKLGLSRADAAGTPSVSRSSTRTAVKHKVTRKAKKVTHSTHTHRVAKKVGDLARGSRHLRRALG